MIEFALFFALQFITYLVLTLDYRAVAHKKYGWVLVTNLILPGLSWFMIQYIGEAEGYVGLAGVSVGGALAALVGLKLTEKWG